MKNTLAFLMCCLTPAIITPAAFAGQEGPTAIYGSGGNAFSLATGSPGELGLVKALAEAFAARNDVFPPLVRGRFR
jgi:tungstate transport system substrate-binding protein